MGLHGTPDGMYGVLVLPLVLEVQADAWLDLLTVKTPWQGGWRVVGRDRMGWGRDGMGM